MSYGFGTWDASGNDNNTGLVKINAVAVWVVSATQTGSQSYPVPAGYSLDVLFQPGGEVVGSGRRRISVSGGQVTISAVGDGDFSDGTIPNYAGTILIYAR